MTVPEDRYLRVGETRVRYWREGAGPATLLFIHGIGRSLEDWLLSVPALSATHDVLAVELPGHGLSDKPEADYTPGYFAEFLVAFLAALGVERVTLVGNSLGGGLCIETAFTHPDVCQSMVLLAPAGFGREVILPLRLMALPGIGEVLTRPRECDNRSAFRGVLCNVDSVPEEVREHVYSRQAHMATLPGARQAFLRTIRTNLTLRGLKSRHLKRLSRNAPSLRTPALIIWGDQDRVLPVRQGRRGVEVLPAARLEILPGCGHLPQLERAHRVNELIREFTARQSARIASPPPGNPDLPASGGRDLAQKTAP